MKKPPFLGILCQKGQFWKFLAKMGKTEFFQKSAWNIFSAFRKKVMNGFRDISEQTDGRMDEG